MRPAFSNALYYPTIDIQNTDWLKTAILFWDSISTIVPESLSAPYKQYDTQYLHDIGFLRPLYVNSNDKSVIGIEEDTLALFNSSEFAQAIRSPQFTGYGGVWDSKMSYKVKEHLKQFNGPGIYSDKMSSTIQRELRRAGRHLEEQKIYYFEEKFAYIYMIVLANRLCEDHSLGMITDDIPGFDIGNAAKYGNQTVIRPTVNGPYGYFRNRRPRDHQLEQGVLLNFIISGLSISPDTTLPDIISFREHHKDELGRFRTQLAKFTQDFPVDMPIAIMQQEIKDLYDNEFIPALNDFKAALKGSRIKWFTETFLKVSLLSTSATGVPMMLLGMPKEQALLAGMGVSVIASAVSYDVDKKRFLRENPYSYLLSINREWPRK